ncbi:xyloglucan glycosyltransferase 12 [Pyrus ussuriensis x Pyrus communis]|uniref:Xyloglucan glycosyltransferase 12 n=1 Tax=Pyrus ussuriensis x Pyrus communis TaxID=2448454 RepID=A0A5N5F8S2_9ROSA|nr:xyloglucan glycosyltransferase 12 [Pyrus ussuriensis x Pyrus communis]
MLGIGQTGKGNLKTLSGFLRSPFSLHARCPEELTPRSHKAAVCLTSIGSAMLGLASAIRRYITSGRMGSDADI